MGRSLRMAPGDCVYHVLNRANGRVALFETENDYAGFERVLVAACEWTAMRLLAYCVMPNHWHLVLWPRQDGDLSRFMGWLTLTHTQRWHAHHRTVGHGYLYQSRFKSFVVEPSDALLVFAGMSSGTHCAPVSSNERSSGGGAARGNVSVARVQYRCWPVEQPADWVTWTNTPQTESELLALRQSVTKGQPFGASAWVEHMVRRWSLGSTLRFRGRPKKE